MNQYNSLRLTQALTDGLFAHAKKYGMLENMFQENTCTEKYLLLLKDIDRPENVIVRKKMVSPGSGIV